MATDEYSKEAIKKALNGNGNGNGSGELTEEERILAEEYQLTEDDKSDAALYDVLNRPDQRVHPPQLDDSGNVILPPPNFVQRAQQVQAEVNNQKAETLKDVLPQ